MTDDHGKACRNVFPMQGGKFHGPKTHPPCKEEAIFSYHCLGSKSLLRGFWEKDFVG